MVPSDLSVVILGASSQYIYIYHVYASGGKTARVDVRIFSFIHSCSILTRFHVLACHLLDVCFFGVLGGGGGVGGGCNNVVEM